MRKAVVLVGLMVSAIVGSPASGYGQAGPAGYALRFHGNGANDIDRVKIQIDDPATTAPGPPADVGATDFTLELWLKATPAENTASAVACGANDDWIYANIVIDRDRYNQGRSFGLSIAGGVLVFGVAGEGTGSRTICGVTNVLDGEWHHVAVQRRRSDGWLWLYVDGRLDAQANGPDGDVSYPDDGVPGDFCGGPCVDDPYLVFGAEKHDAGSQFPSFAGWLDEVRLSNVLRYAVDFTRPSAPFVADLNTVALYHFDEGDGNVITDTSGAPGGPSHGVRRFGGIPPGPEWVLSDAPLGGGQTTTVDFDNPAPPGASGGLLNGVFQGIDFGTGQWRWESAYDVDPTNHIFFDSPAGTSRTFQFSSGPRVLTSIRVFTRGGGILTLSDNLGQVVTRTLTTGSMQLVTTGWAQPSTVVTVTFPSAWDLGIDDITFSGGGSDTPPPAQSTTVDFDNPAPPGASGSLLNGVVQGIDFGAGEWRWESGYDADPTNHIFFDSSSGTSRSWRFSAGPQVLVSLRVFTTGSGTLTLSDDLGQTVTRTVTTGSMQLITTGWAQASTVVTVAFTAGWNLGIDDITYR
jgi:concanavalin A-like lectin/glucanase superfamily protein